MKGQKKKQNGITLIALVISIIVMLILAGVSINALMGDNGILRQAQYASFMSEMAAVEEAVQLWGADHYNDENHAIPSNGIVPTTEMDNAERLKGEVGYYRTWSMNNSMPQPVGIIMSTAESFNSKFSGDLVYYPGGVEDLYYLDNDGLNLSSNKKYIIDAVNSMIYSVQGISLNGVRCYSLAMAKAVMNGTYDAPSFASAEVSGTGGNIVYAGSQFLTNKDGKYVDEDGKILEEGEDPILNPYGFQIISNTSNINVYKLYNNGKLYGKGLKGLLLNTPKSQMTNLDETRYCAIKLPEEIPGVSSNEIQIIPGKRTIYIIDKNKDLWAWGDAGDNKLGLTEQELIKYSGYEPVKLNLYNKEVYKVIPTLTQTYVIVKNNTTYELYACGPNSHGQLGTGSTYGSGSEFKYVEFANPEKIINIAYRFNNCTLILTDESTQENPNKKELYYAGYSTMSFLSGTELYNKDILKFKKLSEYTNFFDGKNINNVYAHAHWGYAMIISNKLYKFNGTDLTEVLFNGKSGTCEKISNSYYQTIIKVNIDSESQIWYLDYANINYVGDKLGYTYGTLTRLDTKFPNGITGSDIKDFYCGDDRIGSARTTITYLTNDGVVFGSGQAWALGKGVSSDNVLEEEFYVVDYLPKINEMIKCNEMSSNTDSGGVPLKANDGKYYMTGYAKTTFLTSILQPNWTLVANNVKVFNAQTTSSKNALAYIDTSNDLHVLTDDGSLVGLGNVSNKDEYYNFVLLKDYYKTDNDVYPHLNGRCVDYGFEYSSLYIKTNSEDDDSVYVVGQNYFSASEQIPYAKPTSIGSNFSKMYIGLFRKFFVDNDGKFYYQGCDYGGSTNFSYSPTDITSSVSFVPSKLINIWDGTYGVYALEETDTGTNLYGYGNGASGFSPAPGSFKKFDASTFNNETVISVAAGSSGTIALTSEGNLYGWGYASYLGVNEPDYSVFYDTPQKIENISKITQITASYGYAGNVARLFIGIKSDGTVWGTGSNVNGVLGRWKGSREVGSRYQTAFEWVELPELEI